MMLRLCEEEKESMTRNGYSQIALNGNSLVIKGDVMLQLWDEVVKHIAPHDISVLITGESGVGKNGMAYAIHKKSKRAGGTFQTIDCTSLPAPLIESELFGHERGSFTGAYNQKIGLFGSASGGTVFLDEIGEFPLEVQPKLLRVLETGQFRKVGANRDETTDVRIIAATNRNLHQMMLCGKFREDLYYRLVESTVPLPPLRETPEMISALIDHFISHDNVIKEFNLSELSEDIHSALTDYGWPGNVRELRTVLRNIAIRSVGRKPKMSDIPKNVLDSLAVAPASASVLGNGDIIKNLKRTVKQKQHLTLKEVIQSYVTMVIIDQDGNLAKASKILGIHKRTIFNWVKIYKLASYVKQCRQKTED
jgi:transcriptional regulator with PAS, ATPase and Fis domain